METGFETNNISVCIVDDNDDFRSVLVRTSEAMGFRTVECSDGKQVMTELAKKRGPWLVFMDIQMKERDGIATIEELRHIPNDLKLRFMTGGPDVNALAAKMIAKARNLKVGNTLYKPFSVGRFKEALLEAVE